MASVDEAYCIKYLFTPMCSLYSAILYESQNEPQRKMYSSDPIR